MVNLFKIRRHPKTWTFEGILVDHKQCSTYKEAKIQNWACYLGCKLIKTILYIIIIISTIVPHKFVNWILRRHYVLQNNQRVCTYNLASSYIWSSMVWMSQHYLLYITNSISLIVPHFFDDNLKAKGKIKLRGSYPSHLWHKKILLTEPTLRNTPMKQSMPSSTYFPRDLRSLHQNESFFEILCSPPPITCQTRCLAYLGWQHQTTYSLELSSSSSLSDSSFSLSVSSSLDNSKLSESSSLPDWYTFSSSLWTSYSLSTSFSLDIVLKSLWRFQQFKQHIIYGFFGYN